MSRPFIDFKPAQYVETKTDNYVSYYAKNPMTDRLERKRVRVNHIHSKSERRKFGRLLACEINSRLYNGWNPFVDELKGRGCRTIAAALVEFLKEKERSLRPDSMRSYRSLCGIFRLWCDSQALSDKFCFSFDKPHASRFMRDTDSGGRLSPKTYNNYLRFFSTLFLWMANKGYVSGNPFDGIERKRVDTKIRTIIPPADRKRIVNYYMDIGLPGFVTVMDLCYRLLIRPKEILMLRIRDLDFDNGLIVIPPSVAKNHHGRVVAVPEDLMAKFQSLRNSNSDYLIFSEHYEPGTKLLTTRDTGRTWSQMREELGLPKSYQFYSLKDTGITEMLDAGVPAKLVKELADHHSLEMTEKYMHKSNAKKILSYNHLRL